ncbi:hypothetical protein TBLA_0I02660 [Henningerozyma blattae CBS 6284]|uniref:Cytochrome c oxidase assembly protein COX20, mitochondrial n=1 Tax=Henningerozyma blattae (strain ATCC 34711 / CBS 6284 / DSM 70876 / NBRC 10599 / NRRL Y-10934 / UCD 77-7) TaxID=1071380 RepID=I2H970_HENB6|nr:hypothetical protein TBLA_0I02660 [Tetrapisispora blattae CBS 6284]CCH62922.1 hypothetical protein TBLA_0I02660 [Tetrapisispora blattae CBS 6284]
MGFFSSNNSQDDKKTDENTELKNYSKGQRILLQDTEPKFQDNAPSINESARDTFNKALKTVSWDDFTLEKLTATPCFRDAGMVGFSSMFVLGGITLLYHKNPMKATNWSICGLLLGSIVGWEQCRITRTNSFKNAQIAKEIVKNKPKAMINPKEHDERLVNQWNHEDLTNSTPWYKFW